MAEPKSIRQILESDPKNVTEYFERLDLIELPDKVDFEKQYTDPRWYEKREAILRDRNYTCQGCGEKDCTLQIHHAYYEMDLMAWEYDDDTLWCLCLECHDNWGYMKRDLQKEMAKISLKRPKVFDTLLDVFQKLKSAETTIENFTSKFKRRDEQ